MQITVKKPYVVESEPASEWLMGEPVRKVSPAYNHAFWQTCFAEALRNWGRGRGRTGTEWRFWITPDDGLARYLVPDVAFVSFERLPRDADRSTVQDPRVCPDVVVEILSPRDRNVLIQHKLNVFLGGGCNLVIVVDPERRAITLHDAERARVLNETDTLEHPALPGFILALGPLFEEMNV